MKARNIVDPNAMGAVRGNVGHWPVEWPHISGTLDNITLSEALDYVLKTFPGIWLYENCPQTHKETESPIFDSFTSAGWARWRPLSRNDDFGDEDSGSREGDKDV